ncbi:uncharacterized protein LOC111477769 isoform X1 [Cucurbita maxima]|uniref:Protein preY, mitochondrial n=1 Tax=Cucurbita maxima TaxID=3661 RepID=A0A6J1IJV3_CUCMA|nr:uncharacterized protein LOC111477769 isoform X1 [Cucurbita maxima]
MVRISQSLLKEAGSGLTKTLSEILVCPLSKQPLRYCEASNSLISDTIRVSFPVSKMHYHVGDVIDSYFMKRAKEEGCETSAHPTLDDAAIEREWCSVCFSNVMERKVAQILPCQHEFHKICVERWFHECQNQKTCPICQFWVRDEDCQPTEVLTEEMVIWSTSLHVIDY